MHGRQHRRPSQGAAGGRLRRQRRRRLGRGSSPWCRAAGSVDEALGPDVDAVLIASSTDTHVAAAHPRRQGGQSHPVREADRPRHRQGRGLQARDRRLRRADHDRLQPPLRPVFRRGQGGDGRWRDRRHPPGHRHQPRPRDPARRLHEGGRRPAARHDHPRLRPRPPSCWARSRSRFRPWPAP